MDHMVGLAILAEGGVQHGVHPARETARLMQRREGVTIVSNSAFDFFRRIFSRVAEYITRIRRYFIFTLAKDGKLVVKEEKRATGNEIKVEATTSGACEPLLTEIVVSLTEAVTEPKTAELRDDEACGSNCLDEPTLRFENHGDACQTESASNNQIESSSNDLLGSGSNEVLEGASNEVLEGASNEVLEGASNEVLEGASNEVLEGASNEVLQGASNEVLEGASNEVLEGASNEVLEGASNDALESAQSPGKSDSHLQEPANPTACEPDMIMLNRRSQEREEEFPTCTKDSPSCDMKLETPVGDKKTRLSISQLNAIMVEQVRKYLQALERSMITPFAEASMEQKATHWRAIILATLVAVAVWARNAKHLHESMPRIRGSSINVHIRSRL